MKNFFEFTQKMFESFYHGTNAISQVPCDGITDKNGITDNHQVWKPKELRRINAYIQSFLRGQTMDADAVVMDLRMRLASIGLDFEQISIDDDEGRFVVPVTQYKGFGWDKNTGSVETFDNFRPSEELFLVLDYWLNDDGMTQLTGKIVTGNEVEEYMDESMEDDLEEETDLEEGCGGKLKESDCDCEDPDDCDCDDEEELEESTIFGEEFDVEDLGNLSENRTDFPDDSFMLSWEFARAWYDKDGNLKDAEKKYKRNGVLTARSIPEKHKKVLDYLKKKGKQEVDLLSRGILTRKAPVKTTKDVLGESAKIPKGWDAYEYKIGSHYLSTLINGDSSGLSDEEERDFDKWLDDLDLPKGGHWDYDEDERDEFGKDAVSGLRGDVTLVRYMVKKDKKKVNEDYELNESGWKGKRKTPYQPYDKNKAADNKTTKELQAELKKFEEHWAEIQEDPRYKETAEKFYTDHIAFLKMKIAERIGKKGVKEDYDLYGIDDGESYDDLNEAEMVQKMGHTTYDGKVFVFYNINLSNKLGRPLWSIRNEKTGRIIGHDQGIVLRDTEFVVGQAGKEKVRDEKRKNVHAGVRGFIVHDETAQMGYGTPITYNPYKYDTFVSLPDETPVKSAKLVHMLDKKVGATGVRNYTDEELEVLRGRAEKYKAVNESVIDIDTPNSDIHPDMKRIADEIRKEMEGIYPYFQVSTQRNLGDSVYIVAATSPKEEWPNKILQNANYFKLFIRPNTRYYDPEKSTMSFDPFNQRGVGKMRAKKGADVDAIIKYAVSQMKKAAETK